MLTFSLCAGELGKQTTLPPDVLDQISAMQKAIDKLTADLASVSGTHCDHCWSNDGGSLFQLSSQIGASSEERARLEELGSEVAQLRERMSEVDRAVGALTDAGNKKFLSPLSLSVSASLLSLSLSLPLFCLLLFSLPALPMFTALSLSLSLSSSPPPVSTMRDSAAPAEEESDVKYADLESLAALQELVTQQQQDQERLIGTVAHVSNEMEINKEHIKVLSFV